MSSRTGLLNVLDGQRSELDQSANAKHYDEFRQSAIVMGSEFGRTPKLSTLSDSFPDADRDHWGAVQSVFFAGGGVKGGTVIGSSDEPGAYPASNPQKPENLAATMYNALGIPATAVWHDEFQRPHQISYGEPIAGLI